MIDRPSQKLIKLNDGLYTILEQKGHLYQLDLPKHMKIYLVIYVRFLCRDPNDLLLRQVNLLLTPLIIDSKKEQEVESLLVVQKYYSKLVYRVKQLRVDEDLEEYPTRNFKYSPYLLRDFYLAYYKLSSLLENLDKQIKAQESSIDSYKELKGKKDSKVLIDKSSRTSFF